MTYTTKHGNKQVAISPSLQVDASHFSSEADRTALIAGTAQGLWIIDREPRFELAGQVINAIAIHDQGWWAIADNHVLWHRPINGEWRNLVSMPDLELNCILPTDTSLWVGTSAAHLMHLLGDRWERVNSFDQAEGRDEWYTPWGGLPDVRSIAIGHAGELYVNIHVGGIVRSQDGGQSWEPTLDIHADVHEVRTVSDRPGWVVAATGSEGLAMSTNGGDSWTFDRVHLHAVYARAIAVSGDSILMSTSLGPGGRQSAIYRRFIDQPGTFKKCEDGLPAWFSSNINTGCLAASGTTVAFGTQEGEIFCSSDAGLTWNRVVAGLPPIHCLNFA